MAWQVCLLTTPPQSGAVAEAAAALYKPAHLRRPVGVVWRQQDVECKGAAGVGRFVGRENDGLGMGGGIADGSGAVRVCTVRAQPRKFQYVLQSAPTNGAANPPPTKQPTPQPTEQPRPSPSKTGGPYRPLRQITQAPDSTLTYSKHIHAVLIHRNQHPRLPRQRQLARQRRDFLGHAPQAVADRAYKGQGQGGKWGKRGKGGKGGQGAGASSREWVLQQLRGKAM